MLGFSTAFPQFKKILEGSFYACYHKNIKHKQKRKEEKLREMKQNNKILLRLSCLFVVAAVTLSCILPHTNPAHAVTQAQVDSLRSKISNLENKAKDYSKEAAKLSKQSDTLKNKIAIIGNQIKSLENNIALEDAQHQKLVKDIDETQKRIDTNSELIGHIVAQFYYNNEVSTVERLFSSENLASYIDQEVQYSSLSDSFSNIVSENKSLKEKLTADKAKSEQILADLQAQKGQLNAQRAAQNELLIQTKGEEAKYQELKNSANKEKKKLEAEQQRLLDEMARQNNASKPVYSGGGGSSGYPFAGSCPGSKDRFIDQWGMYSCECVSYAAYKVSSTYGNMPYWGGRGNAKQWVSNARAAGFKVSSIPKAGTVGISYSGPYGHAVWVERVSGNRVYISQYNYGYPKGSYSEMWINASAFTYIYFGG